EHKHSPQRLMKPALEAAIPPSSTVELEQLLDVPISDWPPISPPRQHRQDFLRAGLFVRSARRMTDKNPTSAGRVSGSRSVVRSFEPDRINIHPGSIVRGTRMPWRQQRRTRPFRYHTFLYKCDSERVHPGCHRKTDVQCRVRVCNVVPTFGILRGVQTLSRHRTALAPASEPRAP